MNEQYDMQEFIVIRVSSELKYAFFAFHRGRNLGGVWELEIDTSRKWFAWTRFIYNALRKVGIYLFFGCQYKRIYSEEEIRNSKFFRIKPTCIFEPTGEESGTIYDESSACPVCGSGAKLISPLKLKKSKVPRSDMAMTITRGDEVIVSEKFIEMVRENNLSGIEFNPVYSAGKNGKKLNCFQIRPQNYFDISEKTVFGVNPFDLSGKCSSSTTWSMRKDGSMYKVHYPMEVYKCPNGDNLGLNIVSEAFIKADAALDGLDFFASRQTVGVRRGLLRPSPLFFCSNRMMRLIQENHLKGIEFEVAHIVDE